MRVNPIPPQMLEPELRMVHNEISNLVGHHQGLVNMKDDEDALLGPFPAMLQYPKFGVPALMFLKSLNIHATLPKSIREVVILTVAGLLGARFEIYAHEPMAAGAGLSEGIIAALAAGQSPVAFNNEEAVAHQITRSLVMGKVVPDPIYRYAINLFGKDRLAELYFLVGGYSLIATILNGFDVPSPEA